MSAGNIIQNAVEESGEIHALRARLHFIVKCCIAKCCPQDDQLFKGLAFILYEDTSVCFLVFVMGVRRGRNIQPQEFIFSIASKQCQRKCCYYGIINYPNNRTFRCILYALHFKSNLSHAVILTTVVTIAKCDLKQSFLWISCDWNFTIAKTCNIKNTRAHF